MEWKVYSETPVFWYTRKEADENQDTTYIYTKDGLPLVVSYGHYKNAMEKAAKHAKKEALYAKELHELKKQLLHAKRIASESVKQASPLKKKVTFSDQDFSKVTQGAKDSSVSQNASPPKSPTKKMKKVKSMTPEEKAKKKEAARKKKEEAKKKKEEAKRKKEEARRKKRNTTASIMRRRRLSMPW